MGRTFVRVPTPVVLPLVFGLCLFGCSAREDSPPPRANAGPSLPRPAAGSGSFGGQSGSLGPAASTGLITPTATSSTTPTTSPTGSMTPATQSGEPSIVEPIAIDDCGAMNPAGLSDADVQRLKAGGPSAPRLLYPYNETVFPRGMLAPTLMWDGAMTDAVYVHIKSTHFEWNGCVKPTAANALELPETVWKAASDRTLGVQDPYTIELSTLAGGTVAGPLKISITIAQATIKGSIYYNSYISSASFSGSIFRIPAGGRSELFLGGLECHGCHTVSANGQRLISHLGGDPGSAYELTPMTQPNPPQRAAATLAGFAGLSPDGLVYAASAHPAGAVRPQGTPNEVALINDANLYETDTGMLLAGSGLPPGAMMPTFAPHGGLVAFNDFGMAEGHSLAVMDFDATTRKLANHRVVYSDPAPDWYPGWPFFLPDSKAIIFARGTNPQFSGGGAGVIPGSGALGPASDLFIVDIATGTPTVLARAMGLTSPMDTVGYVPFGAEDLHKHYYPTVSPVSAGGFFWVFFDSIRHYGNLGQLRQLWGAAISIAPDGNYTTDRSHPAFYLPGQEFATGNHRAFAALDACVMDGETCKTGIDCCGGFCFFPENAPSELVDPVGKCSSDKPQCAKRDERCVSDMDCCAPNPGEPANTCIAGYCAFIDLK